MSKIIIIRGKQNSGKTTTVGLVYRELLKNADKNHFFNGKKVTIERLVYDKDLNTQDFTAILNFNNKKIGFISAGDVADDLKCSIKILLEVSVDIIICCARSKNNTGSSYRMILDEYSKHNKIILEIFTKFSLNFEEKINVKNEVVKKIVETILTVDPN